MPSKGQYSAADLAPPTGQYSAADLAETPAQPAGLPAGMSLPGLAAHAPISMNGGATLLGDKPVSDAATVVGQHLKNVVAAPFHAFTDAPKNAQEASEMGTNASSGVTARLLGHVGLGAARMFVNPTLNNGKAAVSAAQAGDLNTAGQRAMDAIPVAGPWARNIEDDARNHGVVPSLLGAATDYAGPSLLAKGVGAVAKPLAQTAAISDVTNMIRPSSSDVAFGKAPAEGLLDQPGGTMAMTQRGLLAKSKASLDSAGQAVTNHVTSAPQAPMDISKQVTEPFNTGLQNAASVNNKPLFNRMQDARDGLTTDQSYDPATDSIQRSVGPKNLTAVTPTDVLNMKRTVGSQMRWTNQAFDNDMNSTYGEVYGGLNDALKSQVPGLKPLNDTYGNLKSGVTALERRIPIEERNNALGLTDAALGAGAVAGGGVLPALTALAAKKALLSTPIRTAMQTGLWRYGNAPSPTLLPNPFRLAGTTGADYSVAH